MMLAALIDIDRPNPRIATQPLHCLPAIISNARQREKMQLGGNGPQVHEVDCGYAREVLHKPVVRRTLLLRGWSK
jgi:hypothetical protein